MLLSCVFFSLTYNLWACNDQVMKGLTAMALSYLERAGKPRLAYHYHEGDSADLPLLMFCGGYRSDMNGTKAMFLEDFCASRGQSYLRFDYSGHGASGGAFEDGTIGQWRDDAMDMLSSVGGDKPALIVGSSMGGWIGLLMALELESQIAGLIGIAAAPDFTARIWQDDLSEEQRADVYKTGRFEAPNDYSDEPYIFTKALFEDGEKNLVLTGAHDVKTPMVLLQGKEDADVPWETVRQIEAAFVRARIKTVLIKDGDHRLSREQDLARLAQEIAVLC